MTKIDLIRKHFRQGLTLTQLESIGLYSAFRLAARVHELKKQGWNIETHIKEDIKGSTYAEYRLATNRPSAGRLIPASFAGPNAATRAGASA